MKKILALLLALMLALSCCTVLAEATVAAEEATAAAEETATGTDPSTVVGTSDIGDVTVADCLSYYNYLVDYYTSMYSTYYGISLTESDLASLKMVAVQDVLHRMIIKAASAELGLDAALTEEDIAGFTERAEKEYNEYIEYYTSDELPAEQIVEILTESGFSIKTIADDYYLQALDDLFYAHFAESVTVTDEDVQALFDEKVEAEKAEYEADGMAFSSAMMDGAQYYYAPEGHRRVKQILIKTSDDLQSRMRTVYSEIKTAEASGEEPSAETVALYEELKAQITVDTKEKADEVLQALADGREFEDVMMEYSEDPGSVTEPILSLGYCVAECNTGWDESFKEAALALENIGDVSRPAPGIYGVYIIKYIGDVTPGPIDIEAVRDDLYAELETEAADNAYSEAIASYLQTYNAKIDVTGWN